MSSTLQPLAEGHRHAVIDIFNHYVEHDFACFREVPLPYPAFDRFLAMAADFPAYASVRDDGTVEGFGFLHAWNAAECFRRTAEITYFLRPDATRQGIGSRLLNQLLQDAAARKIDRILASISSRNPGSIAFHHKHDFAECGRFPQVGHKHGKDFDVVWMIKHL
jgi:L-amino acid N-acyltransferase YncA